MSNEILNNEIKILQEENAKLKEDNLKLNEKLNLSLYSLAEIKNQIQIIEKQNTIKLNSKTQSLALNFIDILDLLEIAYNSSKDEGLSLISLKIKKILSDNEIFEIQAKPHDLFNINEHEVVGCENTNPDFKENEIIKIEKKGYKTKDRIIRYAQIIIFK